VFNLAKSLTPLQFDPRFIPCGIDFMMGPMWKSEYVSSGLLGIRSVSHYGRRSQEAMGFEWPNFVEMG
jgi:hypothetical protein